MFIVRVCVKLPRVWGLPQCGPYGEIRIAEAQSVTCSCLVSHSHTNLRVARYLALD